MGVDLKMLHKTIQRFLFILVGVLTIGVVYAQPNIPADKSIENVAPDYSNLYYWAAHPWKEDPSDSVPAPLKNQYIKDSVADVFFVYPTTYTDKTFTGWNASVNDQVINDKTDKTTILYQASAFNIRCRVFSPRYRQAHIQSFYIDGSTAKPYFDTAYADIQKAFDFYLKHYNQGRPIIIASHSQGTVHAARLLKDFFEGKELSKKLICAYIVGMPIPKNYFTSIPVCKDSSATGCFVGWRTYKKGYTPEYVKKETFESVVVNPLTWTIDPVQAPSSLNKGGILKNFNKIVPHVVNAEISQHILWTCKPNIFGKIFIRQKNFHIGDINLFYVNIRENMQERIQVYMKNNL